MGKWIRPGYWKVDPVTKKRTVWVPPQSIDFGSPKLHGIGSGQNHAPHDLVLIETVLNKRRHGR